MDEPEEELVCCMCGEVLDFFIMQTEDDGEECHYCSDCYDIHEMEE